MRPFLLLGSQKIIYFLERNLEHHLRHHHKSISQLA